MCDVEACAICWNDLHMKAVDFFCGAGGMSYGLQLAGIQVIAGVDNSDECGQTYTANAVGAKYIKHGIASLSSRSGMHTWPAARRRRSAFCRM